MDRRNFLKLMLAGGGLVIAAQLFPVYQFFVSDILPVVLAERPLDYPGRVKALDPAAIGVGHRWLG
ncbi:hypothetical protein ACFLZV_01390 [Candidatus Margulisiibacteriota bacterium]